jgi:xanthine dehydrogenase accessory factor
MKEINDIILAYRSALRNDMRMALATVVKVEGSSYRQPGARMLITEDGILTGAISGGCLEGDALQKALLAIHQKVNKLITYDTSNDEDVEFGVQLGCNGIVHILFEYIDATNPNNPVALLEKLQNSRQEAVAVTLFSLIKRNNQRGTVILAHNDTEVLQPFQQSYPLELFEDINYAKEKKQTFLKTINYHDHQEEALIEYMSPSVTVVIAGAGNDAKPLVEAVSLLGWDSIVIDGRATHALPQRFPKAKQVIHATPEQAKDIIQIDPFTVFVLMTHNYKYDLAILKYLIGTETPYIGSLGPKTKLQRMFDDLSESGITLNEIQKERIYGPVGLNIGAETSEEIAISVLAEIKAVLSAKKGGSLKFLTTKIHKDTPILT